MNKIYVLICILLSQSSCDQINKRNTNNSDVIFGDKLIVIKPKSNNQFDIFLAPSLSFENSTIHFGHYDKTKQTLIPEDSSDIFVSRLGGYFMIINKNPKTKNGFVQVKRKDGYSDFYQFTMVRSN